jgi:plasmid maintenance system antidote protein VapI
MKTEHKVLVEEGDEVWLLLRTKRNREIARAIGVSESSLSHWKHGRVHMPWDVYVRLMKYFGVEVKSE